VVSWLSHSFERRVALRCQVLGVKRRGEAAEEAEYLEVTSRLKAEPRLLENSCWLAGQWLGGLHRLVHPHGSSTGHEQ
jgi:hypothetical protein